MISFPKSLEKTGNIPGCYSKGGNRSEHESVTACLMGEVVKIKGVSIRVAIFCVLLAVFCRAADLGVLKGVVTDPTGAVVSGVLVRVERWQANEAKHFVLQDGIVMYTDRDGRFSRLLPPGLYDVFISDAAFSPIATKVRVEAGKETTFSPELKYDPLIEFVH